MRNKMLRNIGQALLVAAAFTLDLVTPIGTFFSVVYILPIFLYSTTHSNAFIYGLTAFLSMLMVLGDALSPHPGLSTALVLLNDFLAIIVLWITAFLLIQRRTMLRRLSEANQELVELNRLKSEFVSIASHELRSPLTSIIMSSQMLQEKKIDLSEQERDYLLKSIEKGGLRLSRLLGDLLDISKIEMGKIELSRQEVDLSLLIQKVLVSYAIPKTTTIHTSLPETPIQITADQDKLEQVFINLIDNAAKYGGDRITIQLEALEASVRITFQDNGPGIPAEEQARIFEKFYRAKQHAADKKGTGLGLAITKAIVELHHGNIWVESQPGKGSRFIVELPLA